MRNYVIINGVNSLDIQGLAINTLPPITKPMIRTQIEEIDGRDGDIVTELGYSAYDKSMEIGLWGTYDIDAIIKYFTGEGTITFSSEPDKYYYFKILNQIDYEKLLKFKTATITFHCQPFKYQLEETPVEAEMTTITGTGEYITLEDTEEAPMSLTYKGNTYQEGTPTPNSPQDIHVVSGDNSIEVSNGTQSASYPISLGDKELCKIGTYQDKIDKSKGKNLFDANTFETFTTTLQYVTLYLKPNTQYAMSSNMPISNDNYYNLFFLLPNETPNSVQNGVTINVSRTLTTGADGQVKVAYRDYRSEYTNEATKYWFMLNEGSTSLPYEPYGTNWYLKKEIGKVVLNGSESWTRTGTKTSGNYYFYVDNIISNILYDSNNKLVGLSNVGISSNIYQENQGVDTLLYNSLNRTRFYSDTTKSMSTADFQTWLSTHNTTVYYVLATPTYETITDSNLINQLEEAKKSYESQTNISQTNNDLPFELDASVTFLSPMEINNIGNIYAKPILTIEGTGNIGVVLNGIQILEIDLTNNGKITIDVPKLEAYNPDDDSLLNRLVTGDYMKLLINEGENKITFTGEVSVATLTNYIRWI